MDKLLICISCGTPLSLVRSEVANYCWRCPDCGQTNIDTGVPASLPIDELRADESGAVEFNATHFFPPLTQSRITTAKVYMAQILIHFIACYRGACYNALYFNIIAPFCDSPTVLDHVLRTSVVHDSPGSITGKTGAKIYPELLARMQNVEAEYIKKYLRDNFPAWPPV